ncbi:hypothetical protein LSH36_1054g00014 [Paralvinella palmiformis]|uniref:Uncharacterized protein n=1 Tax=Paralvinella palmiformis TaxID=53620 RepID=A0AAD9IW12_9ANNE|nr:hypothetical protein LSH36_1054g00014 [Paralvinella palmiformis]
MYANYTSVDDRMAFNGSTELPLDGWSIVGHQMAFYQAMLANISEWQWAIIKDYDFTGQKCMLDFWFSPPREGNVR